MNHYENCDNIATALNNGSWSYMLVKDRHSPLEKLETCLQVLTDFTWTDKHVQRVVKQGDLVGFSSEAEIMENFGDAFAEYVLGMRKPMDCYFKVVA